MARKSNKPIPQPKKEEQHTCRECAHVTEVWKPQNLLSLEGKPTLGTCPYWKSSCSCVLLSQKSCPKFKPKQ